MPRFQIGNDNNEKTEYITPIQGDNRYLNQNYPEKLNFDLDMNDKKILNPSDDSDIITSSVAEKLFAKPIRELIRDNKELVQDNKIVIDNIRDDITKNDRKLNAINSQITDDINEINTKLSSKVDKDTNIDMNQHKIINLEYPVNPKMQLIKNIRILYVRAR